MTYPTMRAVTPLDGDDALAILARIAAPPTAPYHEHAALATIRAELDRAGIEHRSDAYGQVIAAVRQGAAARTLVLVAHTDHPAFVVHEARGREGRVRVSGGLHARSFAREARVLVHDDAGSPPLTGRIDDYTPDLDVDDNSPGHARIRADGELRPGMFAVLDLPALEVDGDELRMRAADDLAGCALAISAMVALRGSDRPYSVLSAFTRAEETGLFGARILAEDGAIPREAYVVSIEASNAIYAPPGDGIVVRAGDYHNTFSNDAERYLRVAQERLAAAGIRTQRRLLQGGTCEASAFVRLGWTATGIALPNVNYHNDGRDGFAPEIVRLSDHLSGIALLAEAAIAAGEDASESWWPSARVVPSSVRDRLRR